VELGVKAVLKLFDHHVVVVLVAALSQGNPAPGGQDEPQVLQGLVVVAKRSQGLGR
jgi:hypothetical protein